MGGRMQFAPTYHFDLQNEDVLFNPRNPVNPDSKPQLQAPQNQNISNPILLDLHLNEYTNNR
jgi:hypothetical protein